MYLFRWIILVALMLSAGFFFMFAFTGQEKYRKTGLTALKITIGMAFLFFAFILFERVQ